MLIKIPLNPIAFVKSKIDKKKSHKTTFSSLLHDDVPSPSTAPREESTLTLGTEHESQQTLVQNLLRVNELKNKKKTLPKKQHPALKYVDTQQSVQTFLLSSIGTKQQRNIEIVIKDDNKPHSKGK